MARFYIDCRNHPSDSKCTVALAADSKEELLEAAVQHAVAVHGHEDTPEVRKLILDSVSELKPGAAAA